MPHDCMLAALRYAGKRQNKSSPQRFMARPRQAISRIRTRTDAHESNLKCCSELCNASDLRIGSMR